MGGGSEADTALFEGEHFTHRRHVTHARCCVLVPQEENAARVPSGAAVTIVVSCFLV